MAYPRTEQETVLVYDAVTNEWSAYSTVPKHIRKLQSLTNVNILEFDEHGNPSAAKCTLTAKQVTMKKERVITEAQREALRKARNKSNIDSDG
ncbi:hypothetical protein WD019_02205 [Fictibacillus sp. Mic-4]|uniref:hypothetical protein n=1 Tax=Fictibacillus sp. Mic-4 TaxID=3132826 RepID=UPI003CE7705B